MFATPEVYTLLDKLIAPLKSLILSSPKRRNCPVLEDEDWIKAGLLRVLSNEISSRGFLQQLADQLQTINARSSFFKTLRSTRRLAFCQHLNEAFAQGYKSPQSDRLSDFASLAKYDIYAGDGGAQKGSALDLWYCINMTTYVARMPHVQALGEAGRNQAKRCSV